MKKRIAIFILAGFVLLGVLNHIFILKWIFNENSSEGETNRYQSFYSLPQNTLDYLVLGTSQSYYSVNPMEIYSKTGYTGYNLGSPGQALAVSWFWLREACRYQNPRYVFLDINSIIYDEEERSDLSFLKGLLYMRPSLIKMEAIYHFKSLEASKTLLFPLYEFHSRWKDLNELDFDFSRQYYPLKGAFLRFDTKMDTLKSEINRNLENEYLIGNTGDVINNYLPLEISDNNKLLFDKIVKFCSDNSITLIPCKFVSKKYSRQEEEAAVNFLNSYNLQLLNLNTNNKTNIQWEKDSGDHGFHTNYWGASKTSGYLSKYLSEISKPANDINKDRDEIWEVDLEEYRIWEQQQLLTDKLKVYNYLYQLSGHKEESIIIFSVKDEASGGWNNEIDQAIRLTGLESDFYDNVQNSYIAIVDGGKNVFEKWKEGRLSAEMTYEDMTGQQHIISVESGGFTYGNESSIQIDEREYSLNKRGINIVVIDKNTGSVISAAAIDSHDFDLTFTEENTDSIPRWKEADKTNSLIEDGIYTILPASSPDLCLDIPEGTTEEGASLKVWTRNNQIPQEFKVQYEGDGLYTLQALCSEKYMGIHNSGNTGGTDVVQQKFTGLSHQKWFIVKVGEDSYSLISLYNDLALDLSADIREPGNNIQVWENNSAPAQQFQFRRLR